MLMVLLHTLSENMLTALFPTLMSNCMHLTPFVPLQGETTGLRLNRDALHS